MVSLTIVGKKLQKNLNVQQLKSGKKTRKKINKLLKLLLSGVDNVMGKYVWH